MLNAISDRMLVVIVAFIFGGYSYVNFYQKKAYKKGDKNQMQNALFHMDQSSLSEAEINQKSGMLNMSAAAAVMLLSLLISPVAAIVFLIIWILAGNLLIAWLLSRRK